MKFKITMAANWRPDDKTLLHPGDYRVPEDMSEDMAERAIAEAGAVRTEGKAAARTEPAPAAGKTNPSPKAGAPENKALNRKD